MAAGYEPDRRVEIYGCSRICDVVRVTLMFIITILDCNSIQWWPSFWLPNEIWDLCLRYSLLQFILVDEVKSKFLDWKSLIESMNQNWPIEILSFESGSWSTNRNLFICWQCMIFTTSPQNSLNFYTQYTVVSNMSTPPTRVFWLLCYTFSNKERPIFSLRGVRAYSNLTISELEIFINNN